MLGQEAVPLPPAVAIERVAESRYGFSLVDLGISLQDVADFDRIEVGKKSDYNCCGEMDGLEEGVAQFLEDVGDNEAEVVQRVARRVGQIARQVLDASGKEMAWVCLRASLFNHKQPTHLFHWHFDGPFYSSKEPQLKFVMTLTGQPTIFYPLPVEETALRKRLWTHMNNRILSNECCPAEQIFIPPREMGVIFINRERGALHCEPPILHRPRLFLSIVPCNADQMDKLKTRVEEYFRGH